MKRLTITLDEYIKYGGDIAQLALSPLKTTYSDKNQGKAISSISIGPVKEPIYPNKFSVQLYTVIFIDNISHDYAGSWIETSVDFVLHNKYTLLPL